MRIYESIQLIDADTGRTIQERRYDPADLAPGSPTVEWWGVMAVTVYGPNKQPVGQKPVPFIINATSRAEAFANLESSMHAAGEGAKRQVDEELKAAANKQRQQMLLAGAANANAAAISNAVRTH